MLFNSIHFLIFFPIVLFSYFSLPHRFRWAFLLAASYYFYMCWKVEYIVLIVASTLIDYYAGLKMGETEDQKKRKKFLILSLVANLGILFAFKYFNLFNDTARGLFNQLNVFYNVPAFKVLLPVGISFYTFQSLSYSIDVYRGERKPEKHLGYFALYVSFFPQLVAGPIERSTRLLPQLRQTVTFQYVDATSGLKLMMLGFFKKVVIADRLSPFVAAAYSQPGEFSGFQMLLATYLFAIQIYCDFSGYSDIAIGSARMLGIDLMENFRRPYFARSIREFWKRWHISLSTWFRDYLYLSLGGNRVSPLRWILNIFLVFLLSGLWHGANWTFVVWGALHGFYYIGGRWTEGIQNRFWEWSKIVRFPKIQALLQMAITFHLVLFAWIFFRANSIEDCFLILKNMLFNFDFNLADIAGIRAAIREVIPKIDFQVSLFLIAILAAINFYEEIRGNFLKLFEKKPLLFRWILYYGFVLLILSFGAFNDTKEFIYFQF